MFTKRNARTETLAGVTFTKVEKNSLTFRLQKAKKELKKSKTTGPVYTSTANWSFTLMLRIVEQQVGSILPAISFSEVTLLANL